MGIVGDKRFQTTDGDAWSSGIALLGHYPPAHQSRHAFTTTRDGGALLQKGGLASPTVTNNYQLSFSNLIPIFFDLENGTEGMSIPKANGKGSNGYPKAAINACIAHNGQDILDRCAAGSTQFLLSLGANAREACLSAARLASIDPDFEIIDFSRSTRKVRIWETGATSTELLLLRQRHMQGTRLVAANGTLFGCPSYDDRERGAVSEDVKGQLGPAPLTLKFIMISHKDHPDSGILMHTAEHMSFASHVEGNSSLDIGTRLDLALSLVEDLFFARFKTGRYPPPDWRFANRKIQSLLVTPSEKKAGSASCGLTEKEVALLQSISRLVPDQRIRVESLPDRYSSIFKSLTPIKDADGVPLDKTDVIEVVIKGSAERLRRFNLSNRNRASSQSSATATQAQSLQLSANAPSSTATQSRTIAPSPSPSPSVTPVVDTDAYASLCECGKAGRSEMVPGGVVVLKEYNITAGGTHRVIIEERGLGTRCLTGIPQDPSLVKETTRFVPAGKGTRYFLNDEIRERIVAARIRFQGS